VREYRRSLENQQRQMVLEQKQREIENNIKSRFPNLMKNKSKKGGINKQQVKYYQEAAYG